MRVNLISSSKVDRELVNVPSPESSNIVYKAAKFRALDGTILRERLYVASQPGTAVVMCPGVSALTERTLIKG